MSEISQLGYLVLGVRDLDGWRRFGGEVLGLGIADESQDSFRMRMDDHAYRFIVQAGDDDLACVGWEAADEAALNAVADRLVSAGIDVTQGTDEACAARCVDKMIRFVDLGGVPSEVVVGASMGDGFESSLVRSGFVAGDRGLGHLVVSARSKAENLEFYTKVMGLRLSDHITCELYGYHVDIAFLHANRRHHSIAFGDAQRKRIHHFMIEARSMDDVGLAYDRAIRGGCRIMQTLGRHPNDRMFSFYAKTPSGFQFEFGWGGREVDDDTWQPTTHDCVSEWGHHSPIIFNPKPKDK